MDRFYFSPGGCSLAAHAVLLMSGQAFEAICIDTRSGENRTEHYLRLNPKGRVPALVTEGVLVTELPAILMLLAERWPALELLPRDSVGRSVCLAWMNYLQSTVHPFFQCLWRPTRFSEETSAHEAIKRTARSQLAKEFAMLDRQLVASPYLLGPSKLVCDFNLFALARWAPAVLDIERECPNVARFIAQMAREPVIQQVLRAEGVPLLRATL